MKNSYKLSLILTIVFFYHCTGKRNVNLDENIDTDKNCQTLNISNSFLSFNLLCDSTFIDSTPATTMPFPATTKAGNIPNQVTMLSSDPQSSIFYTIDSSSPTESSPVYSTPIPISSKTILRYFSKDISTVTGNLEEKNVESYEIISGLPEITIANLNQYIVKDSIPLQFDITTNAQANYQLTLGGNGDINTGENLTMGTLLANNLTIVNFNSNMLEIGINKLFIIVESGGTYAFSSFYIYKDTKPAFVQITPNSGTFSLKQTLTVHTIEPATIYYNVDFTGAVPANPTTASTIYTTGIITPETINTVETAIIKYFSIDLAGNVSPVVTKTFIIDQKKPLVNFNSIFPEAFPTVGPIFYMSSKTDATITQATLNFDADEDATFQIEINGSGYATGKILDSGQLNAFSPYNFILKGTDLIDENIQFINLYVIDSVNNIETIQYRVALDNTSNSPAIVRPFLGQSSPLNTSFAWQDMDLVEGFQNGAGLNSYELQVSSSFDFATSTIIYSGTNFTTNYNFGSNQLVYWRVVMIDNVGNRSLPSGIRNLYAGKTPGDVNNDNLADLLVGAPGGNRVYLYNGTNNWAGGWETEDTTFIGETTSDRFGEKVIITEDLNNAGTADIVISAPNADSPGKTDSGKVYIFFGENLTSKPGYPIVQAISADVILEGSTGNINFGKSISYAGDFNKDGIGDLIIGAPQANTGVFTSAGQAYLYLGSPLLSSSSTPDIVFNATKSAENFSSCLSYIGDVNGDGAADILIGASNGDFLTNQNVGTAYVFFGGSSYDNQIDVKVEGSQTANAGFGFSCARGYDVDADGYEDFYIGAPFDSSIQSNRGKAFLYFGGPTLLTVPGYQYNAGSPGGQLGYSLLGSYFDANLNADFIIPSIFTNSGTIYLYDGSVACNPSSCTSTGPGTPTPTSPAGFGGQSMGIWGNIGSSVLDVIAVGDPTNERVLLYESTIGTEAQSLPNPNGGCLTCEFGFSVSSRP